jgi:hypothetical protein
LKKCYREHEPRLLWLRSHPLFDPLRTDARFQEMLDRLGLPARLG